METQGWSDYVVETPRYEEVQTPERGEWICHLFGSNGNGISWIPNKGTKIPNAFQRWMMKVCFDCTWEKRCDN